jgi:hypothetical protein
MSPSTKLEISLPLINLALSAAVAARLYYLSLHRQYRALFAFLAFYSVQSFALFAVREWIPRQRSLYAWTWLATEPILWFLYILLVLELHTLVLQNYKGLQTVGRWMLYAAIPISVLISAATVMPWWRNPAGRYPWLYYYFLIERGLMFSLVIFILLILFFLSRYPISLSRNIVIHTAICTLYLLSSALGYLVLNVKGHGLTWAINVALTSVTALCCVAWLVLLTPKGEGIKTLARRPFTAEEEQRLLDQLTAINSTLLRAARK